MTEKKNRAPLAVAAMLAALSAVRLSSMNEQAFGLSTDFWAGFMIAVTVGLVIYAVLPVREHSKKS